MDLSCAFMTSVDTPDHVVEAERLGYRRAWVYDSPAIASDMWMVLALAATRTSTIGLGPAVLVPSLRHAMTNAAATATLAHLAPGRVSVAVGAGFTGRYTLGQRPLKWPDVEDYVIALRGLLRGDTVEWDGAPIRMLHTDGFIADRPVDVPIYIGADGPKGTAVAERVGDGIFAAVIPNPSAAGRPHALLQYGTVIDQGEDVRSDRVLEAAGHALAVVFHALYERRGPDAVRRLPGGARWVAAVEAVPLRVRHLATHEGHLVRLTDLDRDAVIEGADLLPSISFSGTPEQLREKAAAIAAAGVTELVYQPAGPDIAGELARMAGVLGPSTSDR
jgi:5,10-methylenetetrahydromethanopterin reductase